MRKGTDHREVAMSLPRGSLGFLEWRANEKGERPRGGGRIRDRLRRGLPYGGQFAVSVPEGYCDLEPCGRPLTHT